MTSTAVAVVGTGAMGTAIARRLLQSGFAVTVWNRTPSKVERLAELGAVVAPTPREAAEGTDAVITMVSDPAALRAVVGGDHGVAAGLRPDAVLLQMATVDPLAVAWLAENVAPGHVVDAPVLGSISEAESGELLVFIGGDRVAVDRCAEVLDVLGSALHAGGLGAGTAAKLVANLTLVGTLGLLGESLLLAQCLGLARGVALEVLSHTPIAAQAQRRRPVVEGELPGVRFTLALAHKDANLIVESAAAAGVALPVAEAVRGWFSAAATADRRNDDYSTVLSHILQKPTCS